MSRIVVTGGAGFIGSHLCEALVAAGDEVVALDDLSSGQRTNVGHLQAYANFELQYGSATDQTLMERLVRRSDQVYHLASAVGVELVLARPVQVIESVFHATDVVVKACSRYHKPLLITSSSEVYGKGISFPFSEHDATVCGPTSSRRWAYACAKALDEFVALAYWFEYELPVRVVRLFNTVGPRQSERYGMVVPRFIRAALAGQPLYVHGDGSQERCFVHVRDIVDGLLRLMAVPESIGEIVNLGSTESISIRRLAEKIREMTASASPIIPISYRQAFGEEFRDIPYRIPCLKKAEQFIGYQTRFSIDEILADIIKWELRDASSWTVSASMRPQACV